MKELFSAIENRLISLNLSDDLWQRLLRSDQFLKLASEAVRDSIAWSLLMEAVNETDLQCVSSEFNGARVKIPELVGFQAGARRIIDFPEIMPHDEVLKEIKKAGLIPAHLGTLIDFIKTDHNAGLLEQLVAPGTSVHCSDGVPRAPFVRRHGAVRTKRWLDLHSIRSTWRPNVQFLAIELEPTRQGGA